MLTDLFFSLFTHLAVGLTFLTLFISRDEIGKLYFRVTTGVSFVLLVLALLSRPFGPIPFIVFFYSDGISFNQKITFLSLVGCAAVLLIYNLLIPRFHKALLLTAFLFGLIGICSYAPARFAVGSFNHIESIAAIISGVAAAFILGSVLGAMITGHWYLVQHKLSLTPLRRSAILFLTATLLRSLFLLGTVLRNWEVLTTSPIFTVGNFQNYLFWGRVGIGLMLPLIFGIMIWNSVKIRSTQSATGILYATVVLVLIGETFARVLFQISGMPF